VSQKTEELKRRGTRFSAGVEAVLHARGEELDCRAHNVSRTGVLLTGSLPSILSENVEVTFHLPVGDFSLRLPGRVVRALDNEDDGSVSLGLEFRDLGEEDREGLEILVARIMEGGHPGPIELLKPGATEQEIRDALEQVPIPHRVALAFRANLREREILLKDTRPPVLEALARNPNLRVEEARELAASRHVLATTLELLARNKRWGNDEELRICIVTSKRTRLPLALEIVGTMRPEILQKVVQQPGLHPSIRDRLMRKMVRGSR
jgi:hypothetical protein